MNWPVSILLGVLVAWVIIWVMNRSVSTFNAGLGDRLPAAEIDMAPTPGPTPGPPTMEALEAVMQTKEPPFKRVQIEGMDALLVAVGLAEWSPKPRPSIMDGAPPGSMAQYLKTNEMGPSPTGPMEPKPLEKDQGEMMGGTAPPPGTWTGGGFSGGSGMGPSPQVGGFSGGGGMGPPPQTVSMGGFTGGFGGGAPPSAGAPPPASAPGPSVASAIASWQAQQQANLDRSTAAAQGQAIQQLVEGFKTFYMNTWLPSRPLASRKDTAANRIAFIQDKTSSIQTQINSSPVSDVANRTAFFNQKAAMDVLTATNWADSAPVDCVIGDWGAWDECTAPCGSTGIHNRTRIYTQATNGGKACPAKVDKQCGPCTGMRACVPGTKPATPSCPAGQTYNTTTKMCVLARDPKCSTGYTFDPISNKCKKAGKPDQAPTCDSGFKYNSVSKKCEASYKPTYTCPDAGWKLSGTNCTAADVSTVATPFWASPAPKCSVK